jgi:hypothetical protein
VLFFQINFYCFPKKKNWDFATLKKNSMFKGGKVQWLDILDLIVRLVDVEY